MIPDEDPVWAELQVQEGARKYGFSTTQYRQRYQIALGNCDFENDGFTYCFDAELWGLSISNYRQMRDEAEQQCGGNRLDCVNRLIRQKLGRP